MRVAVLGFGRQGRRRAAVFTALGCDVVVHDPAITDVSPYTSAPSVPAACRGADRVAVCVPSAYHFDTVRQVAGFCQHILVEKPLAIMPWQARALVGIAKQLYCGLNVRYRDPVIAAKELMPRVSTVRLVRARIGHGQFIKDHGPRFELSGGPLLDSGTHMLDTVLELLGRPDVHLVDRRQGAMFADVRAKAAKVEIMIHASYLDVRPHNAVGALIDVCGEEGRLRIDLGDSGQDYVELVTVAGTERRDFAFPDDCWRRCTEAFLNGVDNSMQACRLVEVLG